MLMLKTTVACCLMLAVATAASAQTASAPGDQARAQLLQNQAECGYEGVRSNRLQITHVHVNRGGLGTALATGFVAGLVSGLAEAHQTNKMTRSCMGARGYRPLALSDDQRAEYKALKTRDEKADWLAKTPLFQLRGDAPFRLASNGGPGAGTYDRETDRFYRTSTDPLTGHQYRSWTVHP
jgi:hypothetical protein